MSVKTDAVKRPGLLSRLRSDQSGNTVAMMAAGLIPLTAMIGSGVDISRVYLVKTRLQQACDAGALAGRKQMGSDAWTTGSFAARNAANNMFDANFTAGASGSDTLTRTYVESGGTVSGSASVNVPMVLMQMFGKQETEISVQCDAELAIPNTDVMFVLDTTGSMNQADDGSNNQTANELSNSKIVGLRLAVRCFYEALSKQNSTADCGSTPSGVSQTAQIRFGFVPYAVNVNVGRLLPQAYMADSWPYQSREAVQSYQNVVVDYETGVPYIYSTTPLYNSGSSWSSSINYSVTNGVTSSGNCAALQPADTTTYTGTQGAAYGTNTFMSGPNRITQWYTDEPGTGYDYTYSYQSGPKRCTVTYKTRPAYKKREYRRQDTPVYESQLLFDHYDYKQVTHNVSGLKNADGVNWNDTVTLPVGTEGLTTSIVWDGCVEERQTVRETDYYPIPTGANDLDVDLLPTSDTTTQWAPMLPGATWGRYTGTSTETTATVSTDQDLSRNYNYFCPEEAVRLTQWASANAFDAYVGSLRAEGNTYHDTGLIWGARLISPTGMFAAENTNRQNIQRHIVFMTDGDTVTNTQGYSAYGVEWWDRRRTDASTAPSNTTLNTQVNTRFLAMCEYIKNEMGIQLWVVAFGAGVSGTAQTNLQTCASPGRYSAASDSAALLTTFRGIAAEISDLRLTS
jgi:Flp pilus assembly protein TadG